MNKEDFERLKAVCEKEGYVVSTGGLIPGSSMLVEVYKKDIWEGVEFFLGDDGVVRKIPDEETFNVLKNVKLLDATPSTESAYIEQLKKEANSRGIIDICSLDISMMSGGQLHNKWTEYIYRKDTDTLYFYGVPVYQQGKWATKAKERVEVKCIDYDYEQGNYYADKFALRFESKNLGERDYDKVGQFLASQLEKYLNGEIE